MIELKNLVSTVAGFAPINATIYNTSLVKIIGENGSGKTSLMKILSGISSNYLGYVLINEYDLRYNKEQFKQNVQTIFAENGLYTDLTVEQNIKLWTKRRSGIDLTEAGIRVFEMEEYRNIKVSKLSSGLQRRVTLSRLILFPCLVWIIDEADSYLDSLSLSLLKDLIVQRVKNGGIVFFTAHSDYLDDIKTSDIKITPFIKTEEGFGLVDLSCK